MKIPAARGRWSGDWAMSDSGRPWKKSTIRHFAPKYSPVASYHLGVGVRIGSLPEIACSNRHSASRSLTKTPVSGGGSERNTKDSCDPAAHRTVAIALRLLEPPLIV